MTDIELIGRYLKWKEKVGEMEIGSYTKIIGISSDRMCYKTDNFDMLSPTRIGSDVELMPEGFDPNKLVINIEDYFNKKVRVKEGEGFYSVPTTNGMYLIVTKNKSFCKFESSGKLYGSGYGWDEEGKYREFAKLEIIEETSVKSNEISNPLSNYTVFKEWDVVRVQSPGDRPCLGIIHSKSGEFYEVFIPEMGEVVTVLKHYLYATTGDDIDIFKVKMRSYLNKRYPNSCIIKCAKGDIIETYLPSIDERIWQNAEGIYSFDCFNTGYLYYQGKFAEIVKETTNETPTNSVIKNNNEKIVQAEGFKINDKIDRSIINEWGKIDKNDWSTSHNRFQVAFSEYHKDNLIIGKIEVHDNEFVGFFSEFPNIGFRLKGLKQFIENHQSTGIVDKEPSQPKITPIALDGIKVGMMIPGKVINDWCTIGNNEFIAGEWRKLINKYPEIDLDVGRIDMNTECFYISQINSGIRIRGFSSFYEDWKRNGNLSGFVINTNPTIQETPAKKKVFDEDEYNRQSFNQELKINKLTNKKQKLVL